MDETTDLNNSNHEASANEMKTKEILYTGASRFRPTRHHHLSMPHLSLYCSNKKRKIVLKKERGKSGMKTNLQRSVGRSCSSRRLSLPSISPASSFSVCATSLSLSACRSGQRE
jgi:hypothetical protein